MNKFLEAIINTGIDYGSKHTTRLFAEKYGKKYVEASSKVEKNTLYNS